MKKIFITGGTGLIGSILNNHLQKDYEILNSKNEIIGKVTSGTMSPSLGFGIGLGYVKSGFEKIDTDIYIKIRKNIKKAIIVKTPFK